MIALTVKQPWAWAIVHAGKDIENRVWATNHRGPLLIHAGKRIDPRGYEVLARLGIKPPPPDEIELGGIVGQVEVVGCVQGSRSRWAASGQHHWQLASPRALPFRALPGQQGLFHVGPRPQQTLGF